MFRLLVVAVEVLALLVAQAYRSRVVQEALASLRTSHRLQLSMVAVEVEPVRQLAEQVDLAVAAQAHLGLALAAPTALPIRVVEAEDAPMALRVAVVRASSTSATRSKEVVET